MKKLGKFLLVGAMAAIATVGLVACGDSGYKGEYKYENSWTPGEYYGVKVSVSIDDIKTDEEYEGKTYNVISNGKITKVTVEADTATFYNISASWTSDRGGLGHDAAAAKIDEYLKSFEGKTVEDIMSIQVACNDKGQPLTTEEGGLSDGIITGATQTSGRIILAIQNAIMDYDSTNKTLNENCWYYHMMKYNADKLGMSIDEMLGQE